MKKLLYFIVFMGTLASRLRKTTLDIPVTVISKT